jgi:sugar diacid utilization regulator
MDPDRSTALGHLMRETLDLQRRLTEAVSSGVGLEGIAEVRVWGDLSDEIVDDDNRARVRAHAEALGFDHTAKRRVALLASEDVDVGTLLSKTRWAVRLLGIDALVTARERRVVVIVSDEIDWAALVQVLRDSMPNERFSIGVSSRRDVVDEYHDAAREAEVAVGLGAAIHGEGVMLFEDLGVYRLLAANGDTRELHQFVQRWLGPLIEYDEARNAELVRSLSEYLERGGSLDQAAEALFIHRSTLKYRLGRIASLTGVDLADPDARFNLQLATRTLATIRALAMGSGESGPERAV